MVLKKVNNVRVPRITRTGSKYQGRPSFIPRGYQVSSGFITRLIIICNSGAMEEYKSYTLRINAKTQISQVWGTSINKSHREMIHSKSHIKF